MAVQAMRETFQREEAIVAGIDFGGVKGVERRHEERVRRDYEQRLDGMQAELDKLNPNLKAIDRYKDVQARYKAATSKTQGLIFP